ncbi:MAG: signal peptidase I [Proteobacteria bacterium]|nr:MAG: signal peptidase I [Pseudomonadota bacterium]
MEVFYGLEFWLVLATLICGIILFIYRFLLGKKKSNNEPMLVDYARSFFPVLLVVVLLRSFVIEPFRIPSGSMIPTLEVGDFIVVQKYAYGIRLPVINKKIFDTGKPERGDIVVFRYPVDPNINFIKRLIGLPGDRIEWTADKKLFINGQLVDEKALEPYPYTDSRGQEILAKQFEETLTSASGERQNKIIVMPGMGRAGQYVVPEGHYFMMGDNRDNSSDSRFWGYMPEKYLLGKAAFVWMHWNWQEGGDGLNLSRIGTSLK